VFVSVTITVHFILKLIVLCSSSTSSIYLSVSSVGKESRTRITYVPSGCLGKPSVSSHSLCRHKYNKDGNRTSAKLSCGHFVFRQTVAYDNIELIIIYHCVILETNNQTITTLAAFTIYLLSLSRHLGFPYFRIIALCCIY